MIEFWIALLLVLLALSAFFSGSETALTSITEVEIRKIQKKHRKSAKKLSFLKKRPHDTLSTVLVCNNVVNILISSLSSLLALEYFGDIGLGLSIGLLTGVVIIFGEIIPKTLAEANPERFALVSAIPVYYLRIILYPFILLMNRVHSFILRKFIGKKKRSMSERDIVLFAEIGVEKNIIRKYEKDRIEGVLKMDSLSAEDVMKPWKKVVFLRNGARISEAVNIAKKMGFSRYPVVSETNRVVGVLNMKKLILSGANPNDKVDEHLDDVVFVDPDSNLNVVLSALRKNRTHLAVVSSDPPYAKGIVSLVDVLEYVFGDLDGE